MAILLQFTGSLAVLAVLASLFGLIRAQLRDKAAQVALGVCFGLVAVFQMNSPLELEPGLIVDMRNLPVALAGAFLGWRGALACLAIAVGTRFAIGGVGMQAGMVAMCLACGAGALWSRLTYRLSARSWPQLFLLAVMMSFHLLAAFMMPWPVLIKFFSEGVPYIVSLNLLAVPLVAALLEVERVRMSRAKLARTEDAMDLQSGLMRFDLFARDVKTLSRNGDDLTAAGLMVVRFDDFDRVERDFGADGVGQILLASRLRAQSLIKPDAPMGLTEDLRIVMPLDFHQIADRDRLETQMRRSITDQSIMLPDGTTYRPKVMVSTRYTPTAERLDACLSAIAEDAREATGITSHLRAAAGLASQTNQRRRLARQGSTARFDTTFRQDVLFRKADVLLASKHG